MTTDWSNFGEPEDTFVHYVREGQMQPEVADGRSGMKMRDKLVFREGNNKHRAGLTPGNGYGDASHIFLYFFVVF